MISTARPPVKHAGGKTSLLPILLEHVPKKFGTYYEPFVGGGALFFALKACGLFKHAVLNDTNKRLMTTFRAIKADPDGVIKKLSRMKNEDEFFYRVRAQKIDSPRYTPCDVAAWYIYLNKTCFNGLYRVNKKNEFNTPFGSYKNPKIVDAENLQACALAFKNTKFLSRDFQSVDLIGERGDFVYFDPPYLKRVGNEFVAYGSDHFGLADHERLRDHALMLKERGVHVMISNSGADPIRDLYKSKKFKIHEVKGVRTVGAHASTRGHMPDLLIQC